jgi:hypothetical protein
MFASSHEIVCLLLRNVHVQLDTRKHSAPDFLASVIYFAFLTHFRGCRGSATAVNKYQFKPNRVNALGWRSFFRIFGQSHTLSRYH